MMLFANGCSMTIGWELGGQQIGQDGILVHDLDPIYKEKNAWPKKLADYLNMSCTNYAIAGSSNDRIIRTTMDWTANYLRNNKAEDLFVVIGWTAPSRVEFRINQVWRDLLPYSGTKEKNLQKIYNFYTRYIHDDDADNIRTVINILSLQSWLKTNKIPYLFCNCFYADGLNIDYSTFSDISSMINYIDSARYYGDYNDPLVAMQRVCRGLPKGPGGHPLIEGHDKWATILYQYIKENRLLKHDV